MIDDFDQVWPEATERLKQDPTFGAIVEAVGPVRLRRTRGDPFQALAAAIVYQQLAGAAARTIHDRLVEALEGEVVPGRVLDTPEETLRATGLSRNKLAAIRDLALHTASGKLALDSLEDAEDEEIMARLVRVRGIGPWTAQMFLLFELRRPDVWPTGDLGVRSGIRRLLGLQVPPTARELEWLGTGYRPWRSAVAWYCWRATEVVTPDGG